MTANEDAFLNTLAMWLHDTRLPEKSDGRAQGTRTLNGSLIKFCNKYDVSCAREVDLRIFHTNDIDWSGRLDWVLRPKRNAFATYAIEIDSSNKNSSLVKLIKAHRLQYVPVWIRWSEALNMVIPEEIRLIDLTLGTLGANSRGRWDLPQYLLFDAMPTTPRGE